MLRTSAISNLNNCSGIQTSLSVPLQTKWLWVSLQPLEKWQENRPLYFGEVVTPKLNTKPLKASVEINGSRLMGIYFSAIFYLLLSVAFQLESSLLICDPHKKQYWTEMINPFHANVPFLYPLKTTENSHSPAFGLNTERYSVSLRIQYECWKSRVFLTFSGGIEIGHCREKS